MRFLFLVVMGLFAQESFAQVRQFTSPDLKGLRKAKLETKVDGAERLIGLWRYQHTHWVSGGIVVLDIVNDQLLKVWEDKNTLAFVNDYDSADLNGDGKLDFAVAGSGYTEQKDFRQFIALYLSDEENQYRRQIIPFDNSPYNLALGDIDGDQQTEVIFTEQFDSHPESKVCSWLELEIKIGQWKNGDFQIKGTGINLPLGDDWSQFVLGDVDGDGIDEVVIHNFGYDGRTILIYNLNGETTPAWVIPRPDYPNIETIFVNKAGQIVELAKGKTEPVLVDVNGNLSKIAPLDIPELDFAQWQPIQMDLFTDAVSLVLSKPTNGNSTARQITLYRNGD